MYFSDFSSFLMRRIDLTTTRVSWYDWSDRVRDSRTFFVLTIIIPIFSSDSSDRTDLTRRTGETKKENSYSDRNRRRKPNRTRVLVFKFFVWPTEAKGISYEVYFVRKNDLMTTSFTTPSDLLRGKAVCVSV